MVGEGPVASAPPLRQKVHTGTILSKEHFDASVHVMYRA